MIRVGHTVGSIALLWCTFTVQAQVRFTDLSATAGTPFGRYRCVAAYDYDGDGLDDLFFGGQAGRKQLLRNLGNFAFADVTPDLGPLPADDSYGGAIFGDLDGDGRADLVLSGRPSPTRILWQTESGTFEDRTDGSGLAGTGRTLSLNLADFDGDGLLDIYVALLNAPNKLYRNLGNLQFAEEAALRGAEDDNVSMGAIATDYDGDGDTDLYLTHDADRPNLLLENNGAGYFEDVAKDLGVDVAANGMGVDIADIDGDFMPDFYVTNLYENNLLLSGAGSLGRPYRDVAGLRDADDRGMSWGVRIFDVDHDGILDIYVGNESYFTVDGSERPNVLYLGTPRRQYEATTEAPLLSPYNDFGIATADFDNDGDLDLAIATSGGSGCQLLRNDTPAEGAAITVRTHLVNAQAIVYFNGKSQWSELHAGSGFAAQSSGSFHFGLGDAMQVDSLRMVPLGESPRTFYNLAVDQAYRYTERGELEAIVPAVSAAPSAGQVEFQLRPLPNPTPGSVAVSLSSAHWHYQLVDAHGHLVMQGNDRGTVLTLDLSPLPLGVYALRLWTQEGKQQSCTILRQ